MMHIVMVGPFGLRRKGTMRARALPLARVLVQREHSVTLLLPPWDSPQDAGRRWTDAGVDVINVPLPPAIPALDHLAITATLVGEILRLQPDVVYAFKPKAYAGLTATALWWRRRLGQSGPRLVVDTDDWEGAGGWNEIENYTAAQRLVFGWQERWGLTHCDAVTVASRALQTLVWGLGVEPQRVFYVPNGISASEIRSARTEIANHSTTEPKVLLYTRFVEFEVVRLVAIWRRVVEAVPAARLVVAGQGLRGEERTLKRLAEEAGFADSIVYLGWPGQAAMPGVFAAADAAIMPFDDTLINRTKCSAKLAELMGAGLPVVADAVGQNREYIESGGSGVLVPPGDDDAFAAAIVRLLNDPEYCRRLGEAACCRIAERFMWERLASRVEEAYNIAV